MFLRKFSKNFFILAPIVLLLGAGVLMASMRKLVPNVGTVLSDFSGQYDETEKLALYQGQEISVPLLISDRIYDAVLGVADPSERWIEIDLSEQKIKAWEGGSLFLESLVSTGLPWWPTPQGEFRIWSKFRYTKMEGGEGKYYYYLPNVPYVMFFENDQVAAWRGFSLHGTYWHNDFGRVHSHGCVNLPTPIAGQLFYWTNPPVGEKQSYAYSSPSVLGTRIVIHD